MRVLKLGGTTVSNVEFIHQLYNDVIDQDECNIIVLSALSNITNLLQEFKNNSQNGSIIKEIVDIHFNYIDKLIDDVHYQEIAKEYVQNITNELFQINKEKEILYYGENLSSFIFSVFLQSKNIQYELKNSVQYISLLKNMEPDIQSIKMQCDKTKWSSINIFQGFVCKAHNGEITTLSRGGSDFTATLLAEATNADSIEIWTDIDGIRNNDPRFVKNTKHVEHLNFYEAAELAYFGAKILHPESVLPAQRADIEIKLKNSRNISHAGTVIDNRESTPEIKAIASKDQIILINISSYRMLMAYGFLSSIFNVFTKFKTPIDLITTSEICVSITIDNDLYLNEIISELEKFSEVEIKRKMSIISVVGSFGQRRKNIASQLLNSISNPIEVISYGTNRRNISILVDDKYKTKNLNELNETLELSYY